MVDDKTELGRIQIQPLNADNCYLCSNDIEVFLRGKGLWGHAAGTAEEPAEQSEKAKFQREKDMCLAYLLMTIEQSCKFAVI